MGKRGPKPTGSQVLSVRLKPEIREQLDKMAEEASRPLSEIINQQLSRALTEPEAIDRRFGSMENYRMMQIVCMAIDRAEREKGRGSWLDDTETFDLALTVVNRTLMSIRPGGEHVGFDGATSSDAYQFALAVAPETWKEIVESDSAPALDRRKIIRTDLNARMNGPILTVNREAFIHRLGKRHAALMQAAGLPITRPVLPEGSSLAERHEWLRLRGKLREQARDEVEAEMISEGKDPEISGWEGF